MQMNSAYLYPNNKSSEKSAHNPYIDNFIQSLSGRFVFLNTNNESSLGIFNLINYHKRVGTIFLHWAENIPDRRYGYFQTLFLIFYIRFIKGDRKVIWVMHNKISHYKKNKFLKEYLFKFLLNNSNYILTHAADGVIYGNSLGRTKNLFFIPHPIIIKSAPAKEKKFDLLIWGSLLPYKGIDKFLQQLYTDNKMNEYAINIIGHASSDEYFNSLSKYRNEKINIENRFIENIELANLIALSRCILFTYNSDSVLSSGALMDSLGYGAKVIGPSKGAFKDLSKLKLLITYDSISELVLKLDQYLFSEMLDKKEFEKILLELTWPNFSKKFLSQLDYLIDN